MIENLKMHFIEQVPLQSPPANSTKWKNYAFWVVAGVSILTLAVAIGLACRILLVSESV